MAGRRFAQRLDAPTDARLRWMAWMPAHRCPSAREVLAPTPVPRLPADVPAALDMCGAKDVVWDAGNPVAASLSGRAFVSLGGQLFAVAPTIRAVRLVGVDPVRRELPDCPHLAHLDSLSLAGCWLGADLTPLAASPHLRGLRELDLTRNDLGDDEAAALAEMPGLRVLHAADNPRLTDNGRRLLRGRFATTE